MITLLTFYLVGAACGATGVVLFAVISTVASMLIDSSAQRAKRILQNKRTAIPTGVAAYILLASIVSAMLYVQTIGQALAFGIVAGALIPTIAIGALKKRGILRGLT